ncbi:MAG TPA: alpha/beta hydrolase [Acidimicrobiia bacterium]|jgi:pimeloyl-ACP methyl ester carboxylesterase
MDFDVTETGDGDALVVFVHGVLDRGASFRRVAELLTGECRMVWYDRRGYGRSSRAGESPSGLDGHVADLLAVLDGRRAVVVGHSFGGVTVLGAAARAPELVDSVVLYETVTAWAPGWDDRIMRGVLASEDPGDAGLRMMLGDRLDGLDDDERARWRREAATFVAEERSARLPVPPYDLADIRSPIVYGASDPRVMAPVLEHLRATTPSVEVVTIPGAGHNAHRSAPDGFAELVRRGIVVARERRY